MRFATSGDANFTAIGSVDRPAPTRNIDISRLPNETTNPNRAAATMTGRIIAMPYTLDGPAYAYLQGIMDRILVHAKRFLLVTRYPFVPYRTWLDGRLGPLGYRSRLVGTYGTIEIILFQR